MILKSTCWILLLCISLGKGDFEATWESLDSRELPEWYDEAKFGIFLHWGIYAVPGFKNEWFWYYLANNEEEYVEFFKKNYPPNYTYQDLAKDFTAEFYEPLKWVELFERAGAKYVVLTAKHHDGYALYPTQYSWSWNSNGVGAHKDLVGELAFWIRNASDIKFGLYHSLYEWFDPLYLADQASNFTGYDYISKKILPELIQVVENYEPDVLWADGDWDASEEYWRSKEFLAWLYNDSPVRDSVVVNDRWGAGTACTHGSFFNCEDHYDPGTLQLHKWETATTIHKSSWGYVKNTELDEFRTPSELVSQLVRTVSCGGNYLLNVGVTREGTIAPIFQERLVQIGKWLSVNGEAIYSTSPWTYQNDSLNNTWYTSTSDAIYATTVEWPNDNVLSLSYADELLKWTNTSVSLLGYSGYVEWETAENVLSINFPDKTEVSSNWAWTIKFTESV